MNLDYLRYAIEIADCRSLNQAADHLGLSQPNLSRAMKKLQDEVGFAIFERTAKGLTLTQEGEEFLFHARKILSECQAIETLSLKKNERRLSISAPYSPYLDASISLWIKSMPLHQPSTFSYSPSGMIGALPLEDQFGILRVQKADHDNVVHYCEQEKLSAIPLLSFSYRILVHKRNPLANRPSIDISKDLAEQIGILEGYYHSSIPTLSLSPIILSSNRVLEWQDFHEILKALQNTNAYWLTLPWTKSALEKFDLVSLPLSGIQLEGEDILIYRSLSMEMEIFIKSLKSEIASEFLS